MTETIMAAPKKSEPGSRRVFMETLKAAYALATDRTDFRRNLIVNIGLFAVGVYIARNLSDIDLMAPQPMA
ncbi:mitochondrial import receptor subunit TOM6 homolog [Hemiscyllium ocellatum]|uniref:mitochondrial import receptor subunit TOM6 homolog n=1 Tax=Hemiscyllium ocellatum TaxID=170820 RepID=UPI0029671D71|nr:mitochondrial import receptor subunit TOM6 homolog [Hemiscyllium ocellatum]